MGRWSISRFVVLVAVRLELCVRRLGRNRGGLGYVITGVVVVGRGLLVGRYWRWVDLETGREPVSYH